MLQLPVPIDLRSEQESHAQAAGMEDIQRGWHQLLTSQTLIALLLICYARTMLTMPGTAPDTPEWKMGTREMHVPPTAERKISGARRHCKWCLKYKPDRCHHC